MAAYPSYPQLIVGSGEEQLDDIRLDRAVNGAVKGRAFYSGVKRQFQIRHQLNTTDWLALKSFYNTNRLLAVSFTWHGDGQTYTCLFDGPPQPDYLGGGWADVVVKLTEQ